MMAATLTSPTDANSLIVQLIERMKRDASPAAQQEFDRSWGGDHQSDLLSAVRSMSRERERIVEIISFWNDAHFPADIGLTTIYDVLYLRAALAVMMRYYDGIIE